jgi:thiamine monophosphate synthase
MKKLPGGLYVITDEKLLSRKDFVKKVAEAAAAGADMVSVVSSVFAGGKTGQAVKKFKRTNK